MIKKISTLVFFIMVIGLLQKEAKATEECFEGVSRSVFKFNMAFDNIIMEPLAKGYNKLPEPIKKGTSNFTSNIATLLSIPNSLLQGNLREFGHASGSFLINTTVGILGILNPAEKMGLKPHKEDVGQTLGTYGVGPGCYFVLPILGPSTARDTVGLIADTFVDPFAHITIREKEFVCISETIRFLLCQVNWAADFRSDNLTNAESLENSIDLYSSVKSIYLQGRENKINNSDQDDEDWGNLDN